MTADERSARDRRVLVLAPTTRDAELTRALLGRAGIACATFTDLVRLCEELEHGAGTVLFPEEAVGQGRSGQLARYLAAQPPWSDLPLLVLARPGAASADVAQAMDAFGNVTVLERPIRVAGLVSAVRSALRARQRQYQLRDHLAQRERTEALLRRSVEEMRTLLETLPIGVFIAHDAQCRRVTGNRSANALLRMRDGDNLSTLRASGSPAHFRMRREGVAIAADEMPMERAARGERVSGQAIDIEFDDGTVVNAVISAMPLFDAAGRPRGAVGAVLDVTEQKRAERALLEADRRKNEFLAMLAHELRNPLAPISNSLHVLRRTSDRDPAVRGLGDMIERQVGLMVRLVDDLLDVSRITSGVIPLRREAIDFGLVARRVVEANRPLIEAAGHRFVADIVAEPLAVDADPVRVDQIIANLLNNAAKYTDPGGDIRLIVRREGDAAVIRVVDTGVGIAADKLPEVFDLFMQAEPHDRRAKGGLGIGLTLVRRLAELHGGSAEAHSRGRGHGSEFVVRLPLLARAVPAPAPQPDDSAAFVGRQVLIVDDNRDAADSLAGLLEMLGAQPRVAHGGQEALTVLEGFHPDVALLDIGMPGMDGYELAQRIRARRDFDDVLLVALTGWGQDEHRRRSQSAGFDHHLTKPAALADLRALMGSTRSRNRGALPA